MAVVFFCLKYKRRGGRYPGGGIWGGESGGGGAITETMWDEWSAVYQIVATRLCQWS
jgi:hypothetical protein